MASVTVTTLLQRVEDAVDMENFVSQATLLRWANTVHPQFVAKIARHGWAPIISSYTITATGATSYTPTSSGTPVEMIAIVGVYRSDGDSFIKLRPVDHAQKPSTTSYEQADYFRVRTLEAGGVSIELFPVPSAGTYIVDYIPVPSVLVTSAPGAGQVSSVNYPAGWEEWLVLKLAQQCLAREETINPKIDEQFAKLELEIERQIRDRVAGTAKIRNADHEYQDITDVSEWVWI